MPERHRAVAPPVEHERRHRQLRQEGAASRTSGRARGRRPRPPPWPSAADSGRARRSRRRSPCGISQPGEHLRRERPVRPHEVDERAARRIRDVVARDVAAEEDDPSERARATALATHAVASPAHEHANTVAASSVLASSTALSARASDSSVGGPSSSRSERPAPIRSYRTTRCVRASSSKNARACGSLHSSSRCVTQRPPKTSGGPSPTVAYATRRPSTSHEPDRLLHHPVIVMAGSGHVNKMARCGEARAIAASRRMAHADPLRRRPHDPPAPGRRHRDGRRALRAARRALARAAFCGAKPRLTDPELARLARVDAAPPRPRRRTSTATPGLPAWRVSSATGRRRKSRFEVADAYQGRGVGTCSRRRARRRRARGRITTLVATVCGDNPRVVSLLTRVAESLHVRWQGGEREIVVGLGHS